MGALLSAPATPEGDALPEARKDSGANESAELADGLNDAGALGSGATEAVMPAPALWLAPIELEGGALVAPPAVDVSDSDVHNVSDAQLESVPPRTDCVRELNGVNVCERDARRDAEARGDVDRVAHED